MEPEARRRAYGSDVTYCTNKEVAFDYLRDRLAVGRDPHRIRLELARFFDTSLPMRQVVLRGLFFGIVDEADSVLIDEARVPLIISGSGGGVPERKLYETALSLARDLTAGADFQLDARERAVRLTPAGKTKLAERAQLFGGLWKGPKRRESLVSQALSACHLFSRDVHYLVRDEKVQIVDEYTGRILGDRSWEQGLHQMIELKEGCPLTPLQSPLIRMTYQRFFRRYLWLAGMTGTVREVAGELWRVYGLATVTIPTNRPLRRRNCGEHVYPAASDKWDAVARRGGARHRGGGPTRVGTRSVAASEHLSRLLASAGLPHEVLNARQDQAEAAIVASAGERGRVTVATNMAGRGTDIRLGPSVMELGGLHVIATERHEARRIDRQLFGRCARQGDPGSYETFVSVEDDIVTSHQSALGRFSIRVGRHAPRWLGERFEAWAVRRAQKRAERLHARIRHQLLRSEEQSESSLAFSGSVE
jgi:preprotein translocase subunit SecA